MINEQVLYLVVPCYNEEAVLCESGRHMKEKLEALIERNLISKDSKILFVNDGSKDRTWEIIENFNKENAIFRGVSLSRNKGHQNAVYAGLMVAKECCDFAITIDSDLQDDINAVDGFVEEYNKGSDIVYGVRASRKTDSAFKRITAEGYYKLLKNMGVDVVFNHADYRLMSKRALEALSEFKEYNLFLRGIVPLIGYKTATVYYERAERFAGESKYPLKRMLALAWDGITSFSVRPIKMISFIGGFLVISSVPAFITTLILSVFMCINPIAYLYFFIALIGGLNMLSLGIVGEYVGKIYSETKQRPRYFIDKFLG